MNFQIKHIQAKLKKVVPVSKDYERVSSTLSSLFLRALQVYDRVSTLRNSKNRIFNEISSLKEKLLIKHIEELNLIISHITSHLFELKDILRSIEMYSDSVKNILYTLDSDAYLKFILIQHKFFTDFIEKAEWKARFCEKCHNGFERLGGKEYDYHAATETKHFSDYKDFIENYLK